MPFEEEDLRLLALWLLAIGYLILAITEFAALY
ncbi:MAG: hypothetical protein K0R47_1818 [Brevibacillus sp.]|jgi:hypothetical protein|nr:hypothetical protein [Brevibacillus sp.]